MTSTTQVILMVGIMLAINVALSLVQAGITEANPGGVLFFNVSDSPYSNYVNNSDLVVDSSLLPGDDSVDADATGNIFTDTYASIKSWTQSTLAPLKFVTNVFKQPYGFLKDVGVPMSIALAFGVFWYMMMILVMVSWWTGR